MTLMPNKEKGFTYKTGAKKERAKLKRVKMFATKTNKTWE